MWVSLVEYPKDSGNLANVSFFCFDGIFEMDSPQNGCEVFRQRRGLETGILGRKKIDQKGCTCEWYISRGKKTDAGKPKENNGNYFLKDDKDILGQC